MVREAWQEMTLIQARSPDHEKELREASTIAVLLGVPSHDLVVIDLDCDDAATEFLALNPCLAGTLRTKGARGCALWCIIEGSYPNRVIRFSKAGLDAQKAIHLGEWRGGGCYSVISGRHPEGISYSVLVRSYPMPLAFASIQWPVSWLHSPFDVGAEGKPNPQTSSPPRKPSSMGGQESWQKAQQMCFGDRWLKKAGATRQTLRAIH